MLNRLTKISIKSNFDRLILSKLGKTLLFAILLISVHSYAQNDSTVNQKTKLSFAYVNMGGGAGIIKAGH